MALNTLTSAAFLLSALGVSILTVLAQEEFVSGQVKIETETQHALISIVQNDTRLREGFRLTCLAERLRVRFSIRDAMNANTRLIPGFIRATFHDCIPAVKSKPESGCNGSLRFALELAVAGNARLSPVIDELRRILGTDSCVSYADAIQIGTD